MFKIEIKTVKSTLYIDEKDSFSQAIQWAESIALTEQKENGPLKSIDIFEEDRLVASLRIVR